MGANLHIGLRKMIQPGETAPALFSDLLFLRGSYWVLSTSAIHHPNFEVYGWGEVVPDGFGIAYVAGQDGMLPLFHPTQWKFACSHYVVIDFLQFTVTSRKEMPNAEFTAELEKASEDMLALFGSKDKSKL